MKNFKVCLQFDDQKILEAVKSMIEQDFTLCSDISTCNMFLTDNYTLKKGCINMLIVETAKIPEFKGIQNLEGFTHYVIFNDFAFLEERVKKAIVRHWQLTSGKQDKGYTGVNALLHMEDKQNEGKNLPIIRQFKVTSSRERKILADSLEIFFNEIESVVGHKNPVTVQYAIEIQEELLMNAIWDANPKYANKLRSEPIDLDPGEEVILEWAFNGKELAISVRDPFGSLNPEIMEKYINFIFKTGKQNNHDLSQQKISAGLGMYMIIQRANLLSVFISKGRITDVGVVLIVGGGKRSKTLIPKAIDIIQVQ